MTAIDLHAHVVVREILREAAPGEDWRLTIVGPEHTRVRGYGAMIGRLVAEYGLAGRVDFVGPLYGADKFRRYQASWLLAAPSRIEAPGMINLEAAACWCPALVSTEAGLTDWEEGGGMVAKPDLDEVASTLRLAMAWTEAERLTRGAMSRRYIERTHSLDVIAPQWLDLYRSCLK
jgi:glycosyltransferase involved in cell wall biosynthesis